MEFTVFFSEDYRTGGKIWLEPKQEGDSENENDDYSGTVIFDPANEDKYRVYHCEVDDCSFDISVLELLECHALDKAKNICLQIHSKVNGCSPFVVDPIYSWKEKGEYPPPIKITDKSVKDKIPELPDGHPVFCVVVDQDGKILHVLSVSPAA